MKILLTIMALAMIVFAPEQAYSADAENGEWKVGRVYYRFVCTTCHKDVAGRVISPNEMTKAEWRAYLSADQHDKSGRTEPSLSYYTSQAYRGEIKDTNKAAEKFIDVPDADMAANIRVWAVYGAKDSDTASSCQ